MAFQKFVPDLLSSINLVTVNVDKPVGNTLDNKFKAVPDFVSHNTPAAISHTTINELTIV